MQIYCSLLVVLLLTSTAIAGITKYFKPSYWRQRKFLNNELKMILKLRPKTCRTKDETAQCSALCPDVGYCKEWGRHLQCACTTSALLEVNKMHHKGDSMSDAWRQWLKVKAPAQLGNPCDEGKDECDITCPHNCVSQCVEGNQCYCMPKSTNDYEVWLPVSSAQIEWMDPCDIAGTCQSKCPIGWTDKCMHFESKGGKLSPLKRCGCHEHLGGQFIPLKEALNPNGGTIHHTPQHGAASSSKVHPSNSIVSLLRRHSRLLKNKVANTDICYRKVNVVFDATFPNCVKVCLTEGYNDGECIYSNEENNEGLRCNCKPSRKNTLWDPYKQGMNKENPI